MQSSIKRSLFTASFKVKDQLLDLVFPPHCPLCEEATMSVHTLCSACWPKIEPLLAPYCDICSEPLPPTPSGYQGPLTCGDCLAHEPNYDRLRAALIYNAASKRLIISYKKYGQDGFVRLFQPWLQRAAEPLLSQVDVIIPVPLHWTRLWWRSYNQSAILAASLDLKQSNAELCLDGLKRVKRTQSQGKGTAANRYKNLRKSIEVDARRVSEIQGKRVLLVDDVAASGATLNTCAKALRKAGATDVTALVLAKSLRNPISNEDEIFDF